MLLPRVLTALVLMPIAIYGIFFLSPEWFPLFIGAIIALAAWEWANLSGIKDQPRRVLYAGLISLAMFGAYQLNLPLFITSVGAVFWGLATYFVLTFPESKASWQPQWKRFGLGFLVLVPAFVGLVELKGRGDVFNNMLILFLFLTIWAADIGAYTFGRLFGKNKLAPKVSPGKTIEGMLGGLGTAFVLFLLVAIFHSSAGLSSMQWILMGGLTVVVVLISVIGDLFESLLKRHRQIKDSSNLLPGHGGFMDRIDSLCAASPVYCLGLILIDVI